MATKRQDAGTEYPAEPPVSPSATAANTSSAYSRLSKDDHAVIEAELSSGAKLTATCCGVFVAVCEGHPAYHRWN